MRAHALLAAAAGVLLALPASAQTLDEIIAKNLAARGGKDKIAAVQTMRVKGKMVMGPGMEAPFTMLWKAPNRLRLEFTLQGQTGIQAYDGTTAWMYMPFMGKSEAEKMAPDQTAAMEQQADMVGGPLMDYQKKGHQVRLVGKREVEGTEVYDLEVTMKNGDIVHELIDAESFLTIKEEMKQKQGDQEVEVEQSVGNYKSVDGLMLPHGLDTRPKGAPAGTPGQSIVIDSYEFGVPVDEAGFSMPEKAAAPAKPAG